MSLLFRPHQSLLGVVHHWIFPLSYIYALYFTCKLGNSLYFIVHHTKSARHYIEVLGGECARCKSHIILLIPQYWFYELFLPNKDTISCPRGVNTHLPRIFTILNNPENLSYNQKKCYITKFYTYYLLISLHILLKRFFRSQYHPHYVFRSIFRITEQKRFILFNHSLFLFSATQIKYLLAAYSLKTISCHIILFLTLTTMEIFNRFK